MMKKILGKANISANKVLFWLFVVVVAAQNSFAQTTTLTLPASAETTLTGIVNDNFGVVIGVIVVLVGASILITLIKKAKG